MATLAELETLMDDATLYSRVRAGTIVVAQEVASENATKNAEARKDWARNALTNDKVMGKAMLNYLLGANDDQSVATIQAVTDVTILNQIRGAVDEAAGPAS